MQPLLADKAARVQHHKRQKCAQLGHRSHAAAQPQIKALAGRCRRKIPPVHQGKGRRNRRKQIKQPRPDRKPQPRSNGKLKPATWTEALDALAGLVEADEGTVEVLGSPVSQLNRALVGYMPQGGALYGELSVRQNLELGLKRANKFGRWTFDDVFRQTVAGVDFKVEAANTVMNTTRPTPTVSADANPNQNNKSVTYNWNDANGDKLYQRGEEVGAPTNTTLAGTIAAPTCTCTAVPERSGRASSCHSCSVASKRVVSMLTASSPLAWLRTSMTRHGAPRNASGS